METDALVLPCTTLAAILRIASNIGLTKTTANQSTA